MANDAMTKQRPISNDHDEVNIFGKEAIWRMRAELPVLEERSSELKKSPRRFRAAIAAAVRFTTADAPALSAKAKVEQTLLKMESDSLRLSIPVKPAKVAELQKAFESN